MSNQAASGTSSHSDDWFAMGSLNRSNCFVVCSTHEGAAMGSPLEGLEYAEEC